MTEAEEYNQISGKIIGAAIEVHKTLGPGLLEKFYRIALVHELLGYGYCVETEVLFPFKYKGLVVKDACRVDIVVENKVILELKAKSVDSEIYASQLMSYLKISGYKLGLVLNFGLPQMLPGVKRVVNGLNC